MEEPNSLSIKFYQFLNEDIGKEEFEQWVYSTTELKNEFQEDHYIDLISFPYKTGDAKSYIKKIVSTFYNYNEYELWRTKALLKQISLGQIETVLASRKLRKLYKEQEDSLERPLITIRLGIGFESVMDELPVESEYKYWNPKALKKKLKSVEYYKYELISTATQELEELKSSKVKSIDMSFVANTKHLHNLLAEKLQFPKFYGNNWDALWDTITGLVEMPDKLILYNWTLFKNELPSDAKKLKKIIDDYNRESIDKKIKVKADNIV